MTRFRQPEDQRAFVVWPCTVEIADGVVVAASSHGEARSALRSRADFADVKFFDLRVRRAPAFDSEAKGVEAGSILAEKFKTERPS